MDRIPEDGVDDRPFGDPPFDEADAGDTAGWADDDAGDVDYALDDPIAEADAADELVTNDAAGGEPVYPGTSDAPREARPEYDEHDPELDPDAGRELGL